MGKKKKNRLAWMREERVGMEVGEKNVPEFIAGPLNSVHLVDMCVMKVAKLQKWPVCGVWALF